MANIQSLRGMKDILNDNSELFTYFIQNASKIASRYGFSYLETPILEETALFKRSVGDSSDIVGKEMYQFIDKGENDVCLRPEGTAGVVRMFVQHKLDRAGGINRFYYHGSMFRYERPQKGRLRQFHQFGCESFGEDSVYEDANIILMISDILKFFNIQYQLQLNSLGCDDCMPKYKKDLISHITTLDLCEDCDRRTTTNPIRVLDCKNISCKTNLQNAPKITNCLCEVCHNDFEKLQTILNNNNISYSIDSNLVRGLDYYTKTAFEFVSTNIGAQSAIAGGGRYDKLVEFLGGRTTPAIGFAIGIERLLELIDMPIQTKNSIYIGAMCDDAVDSVFKLVNTHRQTQNVLSDYKVRNFNKHLKNAQKLDLNMVVLIGQNELDTNTVWIKNMDTKEEKTISINDL
jgi:histidyl-tRNA synthetase